MRARNIKPGFFHNEDLVKCDPLTRVLFIGLWCYADREGRFEWRPQKIKIEVLPCDNCDIDELLKQLLSKQLISKYSVNGINYGYIPNFSKHQKPHIREAQSTYPVPTKVEPRHNLGNGEHLPRRPDSLITDSLITDSKDIQLSAVPARLFPLRDGKDFGLSLAKISEYEKTYRNIDADFEIKKCLQWNIDNPGKRKTERGILKHINQWLSSASQSKKVENRFESNEYQQIGSHVYGPCEKCGKQKELRAWDNKICDDCWEKKK